MARIVKIRNDSTSFLDRYADWLMENVKSVLLWGLWILFMGVWFAVPTIQALASEGGFEAPVSVAGKMGSTFTAPLFVVGFLATVCCLLGSALLVSCLLLRCGWWKQK